MTMMLHENNAIPLPLLDESIDDGECVCERERKCGDDKTSGNISRVETVSCQDRIWNNHKVGCDDGDSSTEENSIDSDDNDSLFSSSAPSLSSSLSLSTLEWQHDTTTGVANNYDNEDNAPLNMNELAYAPKNDNINGNDNTSSNNHDGFWSKVVADFDPSKGGDFKILRAIGRTATVNAVVSVTALLGGPIAGVAGYATGGAITAKRLVGDGIAEDNPREIAKSLAVFGGATTASLAGQAIGGVVMVGLVGASLPVAGVVAFSVGCVSGITAGALSEWGVDGVMNTNDQHDGGNDKQGENYDDGCQHQGRSEENVPLQPSVAGSNQNEKKKNKLADSVGAWFVQQRERNRQRRLQREATSRRKAIPHAPAGVSR